MKRNVLFFSIPIISWAFYDLANTIFSMNVVSRYLALWMTEDMNQPEIVFSVLLASTQIVVLLFSPVLGSMMDIQHRRKPYVLLFTILCITMTSFIGFVGNNPSYLWIGIILFFFANTFYQLALVSYNAILPHLGTKQQMGRISGFGAAVGYIGTIIGLIVVQPFVTGFSNPTLNQLFGWLSLHDIPVGNETGLNANAFLPTSLLFLLFSLPLFFFVKDKKDLQSVIVTSNHVSPSPRLFSLFKKGIISTKNTLKQAKQYPGLLPFLLAYFFYNDAISTVVAFMSVYATKVIGLTASELTFFLIGTTSFAIIGSFIFGYITDWLGSQNTLYIVMVIWLIALSIAVISSSVHLFWVTGILAGIGLGSAGLTSRTMMIELAPKEKQGAFFGLMSVAGKFSAIFGPLIWGIITFAFKDYGVLGNRIAVASLVLFILLGIFFLSRIPRQKTPSSPIQIGGAQ